MKPLEEKREPADSEGASPEPSSAPGAPAEPATEPNAMSAATGVAAEASVEPADAVPRDESPSLRKSLFAAAAVIAVVCVSTGLLTLLIEKSARPAGKQAAVLAPAQSTMNLWTDVSKSTGGTAPLGVPRNLADATAFKVAAPKQEDKPADDGAEAKTK
jgi:hypothetical protein